MLGCQPEAQEGGRIVRSGIRQESKNRSPVLLAISDRERNPLHDCCPVGRETHTREWLAHRLLLKSTEDEWNGDPRSIVWFRGNRQIASPSELVDKPQVRVFPVHLAEPVPLG